MSCLKLDIGQEILRLQNYSKHPIGGYISVWELENWLFVGPAGFLFFAIELNFWSPRNSQMLDHRDPIPPQTSFAPIVCRSFCLAQIDIPMMGPYSMNTCLPIHENTGKKSPTYLHGKYIPVIIPWGSLPRHRLLKKCPSGFGAEVGISTNRTTVCQKIWWSHQKDFDHNIGAEELVSFSECLQIWSHLRLFVCMSASLNFARVFLWNEPLADLLMLFGIGWWLLFWSILDINISILPTRPLDIEKMEDYFPSHVNLFIG